MAEKKSAKSTKSVDSKKKEIDIYEIDDVPGIGPIGKKRLNEAGIYTKRDVLVFGYVDVAEITNMKRDDASKAVAYCRKALVDAGDQQKMEMTALELLEERKNVKRYKTGSEALDALIGGGIESKAITEIAGPFASGKTQISHSMTVSVLQEEPEGTVVYLDTEGTCRPERMLEMATSRGLSEEDAKKILDRVVIQKIQDSAHQVLTIQNISHIVKEMKVKMMIIDSGTSKFRQMHAELGDQGRKFRLMNKMVGILLNIADVHDIPILFINQVYDSIEAWEGLKQYGGNVIGHAMTYRISLRRKSKVWVATATDFPHMPKDDAEFVIKDRGIADMPKKKKE